MSSFVVLTGYQLAFHSAIMINISIGLSDSAKNHSSPLCEEVKNHEGPTDILRPSKDARPLLTYSRRLFYSRTPHSPPNGTPVPTPTPLEETASTHKVSSRHYFIYSNGLSCRTIPLRQVGGGGVKIKVNLPIRGRHNKELKTPWTGPHRPPKDHTLLVLSISVY